MGRRRLLGHVVMIDSGWIIQRVALASVLAGFAFPGAAQSFRWVQTAGGLDEDAGFALATGSEGGIYAAGRFSGPSTYGTNLLKSAGDMDAFLCKLDTVGQILWATSFGGGGDDEATGVATDPDGSLRLAGFFTEQARFGGHELASAGKTDVFLAKLDPNGQVLWVTRGGGFGRDLGTAVAVDGFGNSYLTGSYEQAAQFGSTNLPPGAPRQLFLTKYSADGAVLWARNTGGEMASGTSVSADASGTVWTGGEYYPTPPDTLHFNGFVMRHSDSGQPLWSRVFSSESANAVQALAADTGGHCLAVGYFSGTARFGRCVLQSEGDRDIFIVKLDESGEVLWARRAGGQRTDVPGCVAVDREGSCLVAGYFIGVVDFGTIHLASGGSADAFVAKLDPDGQFLWAVQAGGSVNMEVYGIALNSDGTASFTGYYRYQTAFGSFFLSNHSSGRDAFFASISIPPLPRLSLSAEPSGSALSWPRAAGSFHLESASDLSPQSVWSPVTNPPVRLGESNLVTQPSDDPRRFYRLRN